MLIHSKFLLSLINPLTHQYRNNKSNSPKGGGSDGGMYKGRTDDVMKLLMIGFEGLFRFCNPSGHNGMARHWWTELVSVSEFN